MSDKIPIDWGNSDVLFPVDNELLKIEHQIHDLYVEHFECLRWVRYYTSVVDSLRFSILEYRRAHKECSDDILRQNILVDRHNVIYKYWTEHKNKLDATYQQLLSYKQHIFGLEAQIDHQTT